jgi:hypothetical protein
MDDLISRNAVLSDIDEEIEANQEYPEDKLIRKGLRIARKCIENAPAVNRWTPVEDALPEDGQRVLICSKSKRLFDVVFRANAQMPSFDTKIFGKVYAWCCADVIKWMPLPESPENE